MNENRRWIATCVDLLDHPAVGMNVAPPKQADPSRHAVQPMVAWLDLISAAAWKEKTVAHKRVIVTLKRGELLAGRAYWATRWNWGEKAVRLFFERLTQFEMIEISGQSEGHLANVITICNYEKYQSKTKTEGPVQGQCGASAGPEEGQTVPSIQILPITKTTTSLPETPRETDEVQDPFFVKAKTAFNGSTETMIADLTQWFGIQGSRQASIEWLCNSLDQFGADATIAGYRATAARVKNKTVARPIPYWASAASTARDNAEKKIARPSDAAVKAKVEYLMKNMRML